MKELARTAYNVVTYSFTYNSWVLSLELETWGDCMHFFLRDYSYEKHN